jgi:hypothetical protein
MNGMSSRICIGHRREEAASLNHDVNGPIGITEHRDLVSAGILEDGALGSRGRVQPVQSGERGADQSGVWGRAIAQAGFLQPIAGAGSRRIQFRWILNFRWSTAS